MVHLLLYADVLDLEGLISSPYGPGRKEHILQVIDHYERDYPNLKSYSDNYPTAAALRAITKQGATEGAGYSGVGTSTQYIADHHPELWIIEANATYRGWFVGGNQSSDLSNAGFVEKHVAGKGALGAFFATQLGGAIKMGDTPSVGRLLKGTPDDPSQPSWGGRFVHAWDRPYYRFDRLTTKEDRIEQFGILELALPLGAGAPEKPEARLVVENQSLVGYIPGDGTVRFRFSPKGADTYRFTIRSNVPALEGKTGGITAFTPPPDAAQRAAAKHPSWWTDDPAPEFAEGPHIGTKTMSRWREDFLRDFADRMLRCRAPASP